ncbi:MAG: ferritin-like domain-containing protein [Acidimicrobiia bacterium]
MHELDLTALRREAEAIDAEHHAAMSTIADEFGEQISAAVRDERAASRRAFLRRTAIGGATVAVGGALIDAGVLLAPALAATQSSPTEADRQLAGFAQGLELAAALAYDNGGKGSHPAEVKTVMALFAEHHRQHAQAMAAIAGRYNTGKPNDAIVKAFGIGDFARFATNGLLSSALQIENAAVSTYLNALGVLVGSDASGSVASILPIESRHAVVLAQVLGNDIASYVPIFETINGAASPAQFPA